jgi:hypothetical protein
VNTWARDGSLVINGEAVATLAEGEALRRVFTEALAVLGFGVTVGEEWDFASGTRRTVTQVVPSSAD